MIEPIKEAPEGVIAFKAIGKVEAADYQDVLKPAIEQAIKGQGKVRLVFELGTEFDGYSAGGAWEDAKLWGPHLTAWERCAVVTDHTLIADAIRAFGIIMPGEIKVFAVTDRDQALAWAAA